MTYTLKVVFEGISIVQWSENNATIHLIDAKNGRPSRDPDEATTLGSCVPRIAIPQDFWLGGDTEDRFELGKFVYDLDRAEVDLKLEGNAPNVPPFKPVGPRKRPGREPRGNGRNPHEERFLCWVPSLSEIQPEVSGTHPVDPRNVAARVPIRMGDLSSYRLSPVIWSFRPDADVEHVLPDGVALDLENLPADATLKVTITENERTRTVRIGKGSTAASVVELRVLNIPLPGTPPPDNPSQHFKWHQEAIQVARPITGRYTAPRHASPRNTGAHVIPGSTGEGCGPTRHP